MQKMIGHRQNLIKQNYCCLIFHMNMMETSSEWSPEQLQKRFVLHPETPIISHSWAPERPDDTYQTYAFLCDGNPIGEVGVTVYPHERVIVWSRFFPFNVHYTEAQLMEIYSKDYVAENLLWLSITTSSENATGALEKRGLGTLAHILVVRSLCQQLLLSKEHAFTTKYYSAGSTKPRLKELLKRLDVGEMVEQSLPLKEVQEKMERKAHEIFGFTFDELPV